MAAATGPRARCSRRPVPIVVKVPKSRFSHAVIGPSTAATASAKSGPPDTKKPDVNHEPRPGREIGPDAARTGLSLSLEVTIHEGESQESLLRRFQKMVQMSGVLREAKSCRRFMSKRDVARLKAKNSAKRRRRQG